jgi:hypothetical protein
MIKKTIYLFIYFFNVVVILKSQSINVNGIVTAGRFNTCGITPTINATFISGNGSMVQNGALACLNPNDSSLIELVFSNLRWDKNPNDNWLHGIFFINGPGTGIRIIGNSLTPPNWIFMSSGSLGACPTGGQAQGGPGYYFDGSYQSSCCFNGSNVIDGNPSNNYGDSTAKCSKPYNITFLIKIKNSNISNSLLFKLYGSADGNTGCWQTTDLTNNIITFQIAGIRCNPSPFLCNPIGNAVLTTGLAGPYQWQQSSDSVQFNNISDDANYSGTNSANLNLSNISSNRYGEQFRCVANGINGHAFTLTFKNTWTGAINTDWNTAGNWSCNAVPDANTDVIISSGSIVVLSNNTIIRSLTLRVGANFTIATGVILTILH